MSAQAAKSSRYREYRPRFRPRPISLQIWLIERSLVVRKIGISFCGTTVESALPQSASLRFRTKSACGVRASNAGKPTSISIS